MRCSSSSTVNSKALASLPIACLICFCCSRLNLRLIRLPLAMVSPCVTTRVVRPLQPCRSLLVWVCRSRHGERRDPLFQLLRRQFQRFGLLPRDFPDRVPLLGGQLEADTLT